MPFAIGTGFAEVKKSETGPISWTIWNIFYKNLQRLDTDKI